jgi:hypothetical protein
LDSSKWRVTQHERSKENNEHCNNIDCKLELQELSNVVIDVSTISQSGDDM